MTYPPFPAHPQERNDGFYDDPIAAQAFEANSISVPQVISQRLKALATHRRRRMDQISVANAATSVANAATIEESIGNLFTPGLRAVVPYLFYVGNS